MHRAYTWLFATSLFATSFFVSFVLLVRIFHYPNERIILKQFLDVKILSMKSSLLENFLKKVSIHNDALLMSTELNATNISALFETLACKFPLLDPWDMTIMPFIRHPTKFRCQRVQLDDLAFLDNAGFLHLKNTAVAVASKQLNDSISCVFSILDRCPGYDDNRNCRSKDYLLLPDSPVSIVTDVAEVKCSTEDQTVVYHDLFAHPSNQTLHNFLPTTADQLSILWLNLDSVSLSMLRRNLPLTYEYLTSEMGAFVFRGFTKVGDNTFPNMVPAFTGKRAKLQQNDMPCEFNEDFENILFDHWDLIWKHYARKGYVTGYNEDKPEWGIFHYLTKGFSTKQTHHSYRTFWTRLEWSKLAAKSTEFCFGNKPKIQYQLDIMRRHCLKYMGTRQFLYTFQNELTHDYSSQVQRADGMLRAFFQEMHASGYLNHTVVIVMGDHGHRFSRIRQTLVGLVEERMPAFTITFPDWFLRAHPYIAANLQTNQMRLSSAFDIHETLLDIVNANYDGTQRQYGARGLSHLYPIPANRTCKQAGIPDHFCVCEQATPISMSSEIVRNAALALTSHLNALLSNYTDKCVTLVYNETLHAEVIGVNKMVVGGAVNADEAREYMNEKYEFGENAVSAIRIGIAVEPSKAQFEAVVKVSRNASQFNVSRNVDRVNKYGQQSICIQIQELRKYCYCHNYTEVKDNKDYDIVHS